MKKSALERWTEKLDFLQEQEAIAAEPSVKFQLHKQIEESQQKIRELRVQEQEAIAAGPSVKFRLQKQIEESQQKIGVLQPAIAKGKPAAILAITCLALVFVTPGIIDKLNPSGNTLSAYHNPKYGIFMNYPRDWKKQDMSRDWDDSGTIVKFSAKNNDSSSVHAQVTIGLTEYPIASPTLDEVIAQVTKPLTADQILKNSPTLLAGNEAHLIEYNWQDALKQNLKVRQVLMVRGDQVYEIIYTAEEKEFEEFLPIVEKQMLESFQVSLKSK